MEANYQRTDRLDQQNERRQMNLFQQGDFTLSSGLKSQFKINCDALAQEDIETLAAMIAQIVEPFGSVMGVPRGGLRLAAALRKYVNPGKPILVVDDVFTTGKSMEKARSGLWQAAGQPCTILGAVIFARGHPPYWVRPLFQLPMMFTTTLKRAEDFMPSPKPSGMIADAKQQIQNEREENGE